MKELDRVVVLIISLITFVILIPFQVAIAILRVAKGIIIITEKTITNFVQNIRNEILK